jgi:PTS system N-acetylglucosamine-specific IIC component
MLSMALTSFLTGVTEPIEFTFVFLAPALYALHAVLTGTAMVLMDLLGVKLGFGFSAGLFDYLLNYGKATEPLVLIPVGLAYATVYYFAFRYMIARFNLKTPGRDAEESVDPAGALAGAATETGDAAAFLDALGGALNIRALDACMTRLRVTVASQEAVNDAALRQLGARGLVRPTADTLQVVVGPVADQLAGQMRRSLRASAPSRAAGADPVALLAALGGAGNVATIENFSTRLLVTVADDARVSAPAASPRGFARPARGGIQVVGTDADSAAGRWQASLARAPGARARPREPVRQPQAQLRNQVDQRDTGREDRQHRQRRRGDLEHGTPEARG